MEDIEHGVTRDRYNEFVQRVQAEAASFRMENRVRPAHHKDGRIDGIFEVFWDDWQQLGFEKRAMTPEAHRVIWPERWERIKAEAANELAKS
jgi:hypothetical protein